MSTGGLSPTRAATPDVQTITDQVKSQLETRENETYSMFRATEFRTQVVAGINYFIKVQCGDGERSFAHLRVFQALPCEGAQAVLTSYQLGHTRSDPIIYF